MFLTLDFIKITLVLNESIARFFPEQVNIGIEQTAHRKSLRFHRKATKKNLFFIFMLYIIFLDAMLNSNLKSV